MGYSCTTKAMKTFDELIIQLKAAGRKTGKENGWGKNGFEYFHEIGREQKDGAITGIIYKHIDNGFCRKAGSFRIEPDGIITRFSTSTKVQREVAELTAEARRF